MVEIIDDGHVTCPCGCNHTFEVKRKGGGGADRAKKWKSVPTQILHMLQIYVSQERMRDVPLEKKQIRNYMRAFGIQSTEDALNGRISEMYGCGLLEKIEPDVKSSPTRHAKAPKYILNLHKTTFVINTGGALT